MTLDRIKARLNAQLLSEAVDLATIAVHGVVASDLMSDVLVVDDHNFVLLTSLAADQVVRTADIVGACAIVFVNSKRPPAGTIALANDLGISLLTTPLRLFEACLAVGSPPAPADTAPTIPLETEILP